MFKWSELCAFLTIEIWQFKSLRTFTTPVYYIRWQRSDSSRHPSDKTYLLFMMTRIGRSLRKSGEMALDGAESSVADVLRMLVEDRRKREEELAEESRRRVEQMTEEREHRE